MLKKLLVGGCILLAVAFVYPALAAPSVDLAVDVRSVGLVGECSSSGGGDPLQTWEIALNAVVQNTSEEPVTFASTGYFVKFNNPNGSNQQSHDISVVDPGGFVAGEEVDPGASETYGPVVRASVPCDATAADIFATLNLVGRDKTYVDGASFLDNGTPVPLGPTGALGIALALGAVGLLSQRLGRRPKAMHLDESAREPTPPT